MSQGDSWKLRQTMADQLTQGSGLKERMVCGRLELLSYQCNQIKSLIAPTANFGSTRIFAPTAGRLFE